MAGRMSSDADGPNPGTRGHPQHRLCSVSRFPHRPCDVRAAFDRFAAEIGTTGTFPTFARTRLEPYRGNAHLCAPGTRTESALLSTDPWAAPSRRPPMPDGYYAGATGSTGVWVECLRWATSSPWDILGKSEEKWSFEPFLEVSCLTWHYTDMGDYETNFMIELHQPMRYVRESQSYVDHPAVEHLRQAGRALGQKMTALLAGVPAADESRQRRQQRLDEIAATERARADEVAHQQAEGRARAEAERVAAEETRKRAASEAAARRLAVLYDTNYLMDGHPLLHDVPPLLGCRVTGIVPVEVQEEIERLFEADDATRRRASTGRGRVVALKEAQSHRVGFAEVRLAEVVRAVEYRGPLMPDSPVDSLLIEYGKHLAGSGEYRAVVIATSDGGIRNKVFDDRAATGLPLFAVGNPTAPNQIDPVRAALYPPPPPAAAATAAVEAVTIEFGATVQGRAGLTVRTRFRVSNGRGARCNLTALFWAADGKPLVGSAPYTTGDGQLGTGESFVPQYDDTRFDGFGVFVPYEAFRLPVGASRYTTRVGIFYGAVNLIWSDPITFELNSEPAA